MSESAAGRRLRLLLAVATVALVVAIGLVSFVRKAETFRPLGIEASRSGGAWLVTEAASGLELRPGDRILMVDGATPSSTADLGHRLRSESETSIALIRGGELHEVRYERPDLRLDVPYLVLSLTGLLFLGIGLLAFIDARRGPVGLFFLWCVASAVVCLVTFTPGAEFDGFAKASFALEEAARLLVPPLTLHLFLVFPATALPRRFHRFVTASLYAPAVALGLLQVDLMFNAGEIFFGGVSPGVVAALDRVELALFGTFTVAAVGTLIWQIWRLEDWERVRQLHWIVFGVAAGYLPFVVLYAAPWLLGLEVPAWTEVAGVAPLVLVPAGFACALLRYRLWDLEVVLRRATSMAVTLVLGGASFSLVHLAISRAVAEGEALVRNLLTFGAGLAIAAVLIPAERSVRAGLERLQYRGTFRQRRALRELGRELLEERDLGRLLERLDELLAEALEVERVTILLVRDGVLRPYPGRESAVERLGLDALGEDFWTEGHRRLTRSELGLGGEVAERLVEAGYRYAFPIVQRDTPVAVLLLGYRGDGHPLSGDDIRLVSSLLGQVARAIENARLVDELEDRLDEVARLKRHAEQILESSPAGIAVLDGEGRVVSTNSAFPRILGVDRSGDEVDGRRLDELVSLPPLPPPGVIEEVGFCPRQGEERHLQLSTAAYEAGGDALLVLVVHDVSERVAIESELVEKERLAALGMLAAGVAHEVNTPITGISSYAQMLLDDLSQDDPHREILEKMERQTFRASQIVNNLLELARDRRHETESVDLRQSVAGALATLENRIEQGETSVDWDPPSDPIRVSGSTSELEQVVVNLLSNALDAVESDPDRPSRVGLELDTRDGLGRLRVSDTGPGIATAERSRVFEPFFSTKLGRGGTGLGLSISYQIVRRHDGSIDVESVEGEGTTFTVELPLADGMSA